MAPEMSNDSSKKEGPSSSPTAAATQAYAASKERPWVPCVFQMPLQYPRYSKADYEAMPEWQLDRLLQEYGLPLPQSLPQKRSLAIGNFIWST